MTKAQGLCAGRILREKHRDHKFRAAKFKGRTTVMQKPMQGACAARGIVVQKVGVGAKQPNSALRKCVVVQLHKNNKKVTAFVPKDGTLNYIEENDQVTVVGLGTGMKARGDLARVRMQVIQVSNTSLKSIYTGKKSKPKN
ncbi:MAG: 40S ribosomal protein S23 [Marteilia pararefringens]